MRKSFQKTNRVFRGYNLNASVNNLKINHFRKVSKQIDRLHNFVKHVVNILFRLVLDLTSTILLGNRLYYKMFRIQKYINVQYDLNLIEEFIKRYEHLKVYFSHNTLKCFYYLKVLERSVVLEKN